MKKIYMKPDAEYIVLMASEVLTADNNVDDDIVIKPGLSEGEDDWE